LFTVFLQGADRGIGMGYEHFVAEFESICENHVRNGRARAFAFIFYDMTHGPVRNALKSAHGFDILNTTSGKDLTLFYLHSEGLDSYAKKFNRQFLQALGVDRQVSPPCIVFFRANGERIEDIDCHHIDAETQEPHLVVEELRRYVMGYIDGMNEQGNFAGLTWIAKGALLSFLKLASKHSGLF